MNSFINLESIRNDFDIHITPKKNENPEDANLRRFKDKYLFLATLAAFASIFVICTIILFRQAHSPLSSIALNGIIGLGLGLAGYYVRGKKHD